MFTKLKLLLNRLLPKKFQFIIVGCLIGVLVISSGIFMIPVVAQQITGIPGSPSATTTIKGAVDC